MLVFARSEADLSKGCTFAPAINRSSQRLLVQSEDIPANFYERQKYFDQLAKEKKQLLQLAIEDRECRFSPSTTDAADVALMGSR